MSYEILEVFDSHHHIWSDGGDNFPWVVEPIDELKSKATLEEYLASTGPHEDCKDNDNRAPNRQYVISISKSLIVQPVNHKFDHDYLFEALKKIP